LILKGVKAEYGLAPWNVGVYRKNNKNNFDLICGGSLIAPNLVVSGKLHANVYYTCMKLKIISKHFSCPLFLE